MGALKRVLSAVVPAGFCSPRWLDRHLPPGSFILSDCEGYEGELFGRAGAAVRARFAGTHAVAAVGVAPPPPPPVPLDFLTPAEAAAATREHRGAQEWLLFTPTRPAG